MKLLTANRLTDGLTLWYTGTLEAGTWGEDAALASRLSDDDADALLIVWKLRETDVVAPYLIPLTETGTPVQREHVREFVRANGPTIGQTADAIASAHNRADIFEN
ncbi:hypothetical protein ABI_07330 [Asticcacaulis biprosthecium C19]|uniref:Uncharacterized protein n=1 Tax=Asticcacaulis biprosthecium C19 TaxID=715226 RepID=F4QLF4_9CAUL|nr:DUF2849 domain-containing protein [Asticcacaulis biprosthecium]EGF92299.1 hypothetical protein ABI_07330 [Asticcacaulis biprosthecium C19]